MTERLNWTCWQKPQGLLWGIKRWIPISELLWRSSDTACLSWGQYLAQISCTSDRSSDYQPLSWKFLGGSLGISVQQVPSMGLLFEGWGNMGGCRWWSQPWLPGGMKRKPLSVMFGHWPPSDTIHSFLFCQHLGKLIRRLNPPPPLGAVKVKVTQSCLTLCDPMDCTVQGILLARILEWVAFPFSRGSSQPRNWTGVSCIAGGFFINWAMKEAPLAQWGCSNPSPRAGTPVCWLLQPKPPPILLQPLGLLATNPISPKSYDVRIHFSLSSWAPALLF